MKKQTRTLIRLAAFLPLTLSLVACTAGKIDPAKALSRMHIAKSDDFKERPGWNALVRLGDDDCQAYRSGGESLIKWDGPTCDTKAIIDYVNKKPQLIPVFYAAYHEYGTDGVGVISAFSYDERTEEGILRFIAKLMEKLTNKNIVDNIYDDFKKDRWSMGLNDVDKEEFFREISSFRVKQEQVEERYQKAHNENQQRYKAENAARLKREQEELLASERGISLVLWQNPTPEQRMIIDALRTVKFTIRNDGMAYANGRRFMAVAGLEYLRNSLNLSMRSCSDVGAYIGEKVLRRACVQGSSRDIVEWGKTAKDSSISDEAWISAAMKSIVNYNPIKYEILFSHWAGMARVYTSRGY